MTAIAFLVSLAGIALLQKAAVPAGGANDPSTTTQQAARVWKVAGVLLTIVALVPILSRHRLTTAIPVWISCVCVAGIVMTFRGRAIACVINLLQKLPGRQAPGSSQRRQSGTFVHLAVVLAAAVAAFVLTVAAGAFLPVPRQSAVALASLAFPLLWAGFTIAFYWCRSDRIAWQVSAFAAVPLLLLLALVIVQS